MFRWINNKEKKVRKNSFERIKAQIEKRGLRKILLFSDTDLEYRLVDNIRDYFDSLERYALKVDYAGLIDSKVSTIKKELLTLSFYEEKKYMKNSLLTLSEKIDVKKLAFLAKKFENLTLCKMLDLYYEENNDKSILDFLWESYKTYAYSEETITPIRYAQEISSIIPPESNLSHLMFLYGKKRPISSNIAYDSHFAYEKVSHGFTILGGCSELFNLRGYPSNYLCFSIRYPNDCDENNISKFIISVIEHLYVGNVLLGLSYHKKQKNECLMSGVTSSLYFDENTRTDLYCDYCTKRSNHDAKYLIR